MIFGCFWFEQVIFIAINYIFVDELSGLSLCICVRRGLCFFFCKLFYLFSSLSLIATHAELNISLRISNSVFRFFGNSANYFNQSFFGYTRAGWLSALFIHFFGHTLVKCTNCAFSYFSRIYQCDLLSKITSTFGSAHFKGNLPVSLSLSFTRSQWSMQHTEQARAVFGVTN